MRTTRRKSERREGRRRYETAEKQLLTAGCKVRNCAPAAAKHSFTSRSLLTYQSHLTLLGSQRVLGQTLVDAEVRWLQVLDDQLEVRLVRSALHFNLVLLAGLDVLARLLYPIVCGRRIRFDVAVEDCFVLERASNAEVRDPDGWRDWNGHRD